MASKNRQSANNGSPPASLFGDMKFNVRQHVKPCPDQVLAKPLREVAFFLGSIRVNRRPIVWLAPRRQGRVALSPFDFHL